MRLANRPLLVPVLVVASLVVSGAGMLLLETPPGAPVMYHQLPLSDGEQQQRDAINQVFASAAAPSGTPRRALQDNVHQAWLGAVQVGAGVQSPLRLNAIRAMFEGAMNGATPDAAEELDAQEREVVEATNRGWAQGLLEGLDANPTTAQSALLSDVSEGFSEGTAHGADASSPSVNPTDYTVWARAMSDHAVGWVKGQYGSMPPAPLGAQGTALEAWAMGVAEGAIGGFLGGSQQRLEMYEAWSETLSAWAFDRVLTQTPPTPGTPIAEGLQAWAEGFSEGAFGNAPPSPDAGDGADWDAWARGVLSEAIHRATDPPDTTPASEGIAFLLAWAEGLGSNSDFPGEGDGQAIQDALTAFGEQMAEDAHDFLEASGGSWPAQRLEEAQAWAEGMAAAAQALAPQAGADPEAIRAWVERMNAAFQDMPGAPGAAGADVIRGYAQGSAEGFFAIWSGFVGADASELQEVVEATADALGAALPEVAGDPGVNGDFAEEFTSGLISSLDDDPVLGVFDAGELLAAYLQGSLEGSVRALYGDAWRTVAEGANALKALSAALAEPAARYAWEKLNNTDPSDLAQAADDTAAWGRATAEALLPTLQEAVDQTTVPSPGEVGDYLDRLGQEALKAPLAPPGVDEEALQNFLDIAVQPTRWLWDEDVNMTTVEAARGFAEELVNNANLSDLDGFTAHLVEMARGTFEGLEAFLGDAGNVTGTGPYARAQAQATRAWAEGIARAITEAEPPSGGVDPQPYRDWASSMAEAARQGISDLGDEAGLQADAIRAFADETGEWLLGLPGDEPPPPPDPALRELIAAAVDGLIGNFTPPDRPDLDPSEQIEAGRQWFRGILDAAMSPAPPAGDYTSEQLEAMDAYFGEVGAAARAFAEALQGELPDDRGDVPNVTKLVDHLLTELLEQGGPLAPTTGHVNETAAWARGTAEGLAEALGTDPGLDPGPMRDWLTWSLDALQQLPGNLSEAERELIDAYAGGLISGAGDFASYLQGRADDPGHYVEQLQNPEALARGLIDAVFIFLLSEEVADPDEPPENETVVRANALAEYAVFGGMQALLGGGREAYVQVNAYAEAVVTRGLESVGGPENLDPDAMGQYIEGVMQGGLERIVNRTPAAAGQQVAVLRAWAGGLGNLSLEDLFEDLSPDDPGEGDWKEYGMALASAIANFPSGPTERHIAAWRAWGEAVLAAGQGLSTAPTEENTARMQAWVEATVAGFSSKLPPFDPTQVSADPVAWQAYVEAMAAWLEGFGQSAVTDLPRYPPPPAGPGVDTEWVTWAVEDALAGLGADHCGASLLPQTCNAIMEIVGEATGDALADVLNDNDGEPSEDPPPPSGGSGGSGGGSMAGSLVAGVAQALQRQPDAERAGLAGAVEGAVKALIKSPPEDPAAAQAWAEESIAAIGALAPDLEGASVPDPAGLAEDLVFALTTHGPGALNVAGLPAMPPDQPRLWAEAVVAAVARDLAARGVALPVDPAARLRQVDAMLQGLLGTAPPRPGESGLETTIGVRVSDGTNSAQDEELDGTAMLRGDEAHEVTAQVPPSVDAPGASWAVGYAVGGFSAQNQGQQVPLIPGEGGYRGYIPEGDLRGAPEGSTVELVILRIVPGAPPLRLDNRGEPWAYRLDAAAPEFSIQAPPKPTGTTFTVSWSGTDPAGGAGIAGYAVHVRRGGETTTLFEDTEATAFEFAGEPGATYEFVGVAEDRVGHRSGPASVTVRTPGAPAVPGQDSASGVNHAPAISSVDPASGAHRGTLTARVDASDPDGTRPAVRVSLEPVNGGEELPVWSGFGGTFPLVTTLVPDGTYRLHAIATDGSLGSGARGGSFVVDNTAPRLEGPKPARGPEGGVHLLARSEDAELMTVALSPKDAPGQVQRFVMRDDGTHGDARPGDGWFTVQVFVAPGPYIATVSATDKAGNTLQRAEEVHIVNTPKATQLPVPVTPGTTGGQAAPPVQQPAKKGGLFGLPGFEVALLAAALLVTALATRRKK